MMRRIGALVCSLALCSSTLVFGRTYSPQVTMVITPPSGQSRTLTTHESGTATLTVDGVEYGFRPTMLDDQGMRDVITVFRMGTATAATSVLGDVEVKLGGQAAATKTTPAFKVAVTNIDNTRK